MIKTTTEIYSNHSTNYCIWSTQFHITTKTDWNAGPGWSRWKQISNCVSRLLLMPLLQSVYRQIIFRKHFSKPSLLYHCTNQEIIQTLLIIGLSQFSQNHCKNTITNAFVLILKQICCCTPINPNSENTIHARGQMTYKHKQRVFSRPSCRLCQGVWCN